MTNGFVDTYLLACPPDTCTREEFEAYVASLLRWRDFVLSGLMPVYISANAAAVLGETGGFPPWETLRSLITKLGVQGVHPRDLFPIFQRFLDRLPKLEDALGIREILLEGIACAPDDYKARNNVFTIDFERLTGLLCIFVLKTSYDANQQLLLTRDFGQCPDNIKFEATIADIEYLPGVAVSALPTDLAGEFVAFSCAKNCKRNLVPELMWSQAASEVAYVAALELYSQRFSAASGARAPKRWAFGQQFISSVEQLNLKTPTLSRSVLRACAETVLDQNLGATHAIRVNRGANSAQKKRSANSAWRRDIDHEYHLHYWAGSDSIEFASVVAHNDFSIPD
jgi:hypothetical protein